MLVTNLAFHIKQIKGVGECEKNAAWKIIFIYLIYENMFFTPGVQMLWNFEILSKVRFLKDN